jgi:phage terminase small subunit
MQSMNPATLFTTLNPRQTRFAENLLRGQSLTDAYRDAGYTATGPAAHTGASKLMARPEIAAHLARLRDQATEKAVMDRREILTRLTRVLRSEADDLNHPDALIHSVVRKTTVRADGARIVRVITKTMSKHTAIRQLSNLLNIHPPTAIAAAESSQQAQKELLLACANHPTASSTSRENTPKNLTLPANSSSVTRRIGHSLNPRQRLFCEHLARGLPAAKAYLKAGYTAPHSESPDPTRLFQRPAVIHYLRDLHRHSLLTSHATAHELLTFLTQAARATAPQLETQARFIDQIVQIQTITTTNPADPTAGKTESETQTWQKSITPPRALHQLSNLLWLREIQ